MIGYERIVASFRRRGFARGRLRGRVQVTRHDRTRTFAHVHETADGHLCLALEFGDVRRAVGPREKQRDAGRGASGPSRASGAVRVRVRRLGHVRVYDELDAG